MQEIFRFDIGPGCGFQPFGFSGKSSQGFLLEHARLLASHMSIQERGEQFEVCPESVGIIFFVMSPRHEFAKL